jgi:hypothetical protein
LLLRYLVTAGQAGITRACKRTFRAHDVRHRPDPQCSASRKSPFHVFRDPARIKSRPKTDAGFREHAQQYVTSVGPGAVMAS